LNPLAAAVFPLVFAVAAATTPPPARLQPDEVLARYLAILATTHPPELVTFEYNVEQSGAQNIDQAHRIYRGGGRERDETIAVNGHVLAQPAVRVVKGRIDRYSIGRVAPTPQSYKFTFVGARLAGHHWEYLFETAPFAPAPFAVESVVIDGAYYLPSLVRFTSRGAGMVAKGELRYARVRSAWLIQEANVTSNVGDSQVRERIVWHNYQFPESLPPSTFGEPAPAPTPAL